MTMASGDTGFAGCALIESDFEGVLFAGAGLRKRDQVAVVACELGLEVVLLCKVGDRSVEFLLIGEEIVDEGFLWREAGHGLVFLNR